MVGKGRRRLEGSLQALAGLSGEICEEFIALGMRNEADLPPWHSLNPWGGHWGHCQGRMGLMFPSNRFVSVRKQGGSDCCPDSFNQCEISAPSPLDRHSETAFRHTRAGNVFSKRHKELNLCAE